jgi:hypothetical protein
MLLQCDFLTPRFKGLKGNIMDIQVRHILSKAAFHGITRDAITKRAAIAPSSFTNWKTKNPNITTLNKAIVALDEIIAELENEKVEG